MNEGKQRLLVRFAGLTIPTPLASTAPRRRIQIAELQRELDAARRDADAAARELRATRVELATANQALASRHGELQQELRGQRAVADDLREVLRSSDVATLRLDRDLNIRLFTPAIRTLFGMIPSDVGRPLADLDPRVSDAALLADARQVLCSLQPSEREIEARGGMWYLRRIVPFRSHGRRVDGVVITFLDITHRRRAADALRMANAQTELARTTLGVVSGTLDALLDVSRIKAGSIRPNLVTFAFDELLKRLNRDRSDPAHVQRHGVRVVPSRAIVRSDPHC